jgi:acetoin utilization deacetylase AcuC-like enzyme
MTTPVFYPALHASHQPQKDLSDGLPGLDHPETPQRIDAVLNGILSLGDEYQRIDETGLAEAAVRALHDADYVDFLLAIEKQIEPGTEYIPSIFHDNMQNSPLAFRGGMYCREIGTPIGVSTVVAALNAAATAESAAQYVLREQQDAIALCRPPGHHAGRRRYGGYCYFNNAYIAASILSNETGCCPVLDIDYHLGDGSIEFSNAQMPYFSLNADPWGNYPYLDSDEKLELPHARVAILPDHTDVDRYLSLLHPILDNIESRQPDYAVISLGFDTLDKDRIQDAKIHIQASDFEQLGHAIGSRIQKPVLLLLEGGYDTNRLDQCMHFFLTGFMSTR